LLGAQILVGLILAPVHAAVWSGPAAKAMSSEVAMNIGFISSKTHGVLVLPMGVHLALDALGGLTLLTLAGLMRGQSRFVRAVTAGVGLFYLAAAVLTETRSGTEGWREMRRHPAEARPIKRVAEHRRPQAAAPIPGEEEAPAAGLM
jgi:hypothetical protein